MRLKGKICNVKAVFLPSSRESIAITLSRRRPAEWNTPNKGEFDKNLNISGQTKIVAMTENGPIPDINQSLDGRAPWSFFMSWNDVHIGNSDQHLKDVYWNPRVITLENVNYGGGSCAATGITPYVQVNSVWTQTATATVRSGTKVVLGPQLSSGGSWSWNGGCGTSGTSREQTIYPTADCDIVATYTNSCGAKSTYTFQMKINWNARLSSDVEKEKIDFYPNPSEGTFKVRGVSEGRLRIFTLTGKLMFDKDIKEQSDITPGLVPGMYLLKIEYQGKVTTSKLIIK